MQDDLNMHKLHIFKGTLLPDVDQAIRKSKCLFLFYFIFFFDLGFTGLSRVFHLYSQFHYENSWVTTEMDDQIPELIVL